MALQFNLNPLMSALLLVFLTPTTEVQAEYNEQRPNVGVSVELDVSKDLRPFYKNSESEYMISTYEADIEKANDVCHSLAVQTHREYHLVILETAKESSELASRLNDSKLDIANVWTAGRRPDESIFYWDSLDDTELPMTFKNFHSDIDFKSSRHRRSLLADSGLRRRKSRAAVKYPWGEKINGSSSSAAVKCKNGVRLPEGCNANIPIPCNVTLPACNITTPSCSAITLPECSVIRPECSARCENCTVVVPPVCFAQPQPCNVTAGNCTAIPKPCQVTTPPCFVNRPPCESYLPPCIEVSTPKPCTTKKPCIPTNCTTVTPPCFRDATNKTVCPKPTTECNQCPVEICQVTATICPPAVTHCPPPEIVCPEPIVDCDSKPDIICEDPIVNCPEPKVVCTEAQVHCSSPIVNCPPLVSSCTRPDLTCPAPDLDCPPPIVDCPPVNPNPCPQVPTPEPCEEDETTTPTTPLPTTSRPPCPGCGCVCISKEKDFKWNVDKCSQRYHFICEAPIQQNLPSS